MQLKLNERADEEKPYERCMRFGPEALTDTELMAVLLRSGSKDHDVMNLADSIISNNYAYEGISSILHLSYEELIAIKGIGKIKALQIICLSELCKRLWKSGVSKDIQTFDTPVSCAAYYQQDMKFLEREVLVVAFLDLRKRLICDTRLTVGTINSSLVSVREVLIEALKHRAVGILLVHNHPTGEPYPSTQDIEVTDRLKTGCEAVGIALHDHVIIGHNSYFSFRERDYLK